MAVREVMTLPAVWDDRLNIVSAGLATFLATVGASIAGAMAIIGTSIYDGLAAKLSDGIWKDLGARNAQSYIDGWVAVLDPGSPSKTMMKYGRSAREGFEIGANGGTTKNYTLNITTTQPSVNLAASYRMLEAMG